MKRIIMLFALIGSFLNQSKAQLGTVKGDALEISNIVGSTISNNMMRKIWLYRNNVGNDWLSTSLHDGIAVDVSFLQPQVNSRTWWERNPGSGTQMWGDMNQTFMVLYGGNLGLGTLTPTSKLEVAGEVNLKYNSIDGYWFKHTDLAGNIIAGFKRSGNNLLIRAFDGIEFSVGNNENKAVTILTNGNFGIGTATPGEKLSVNGNIRAREIKVEATNWPDYVFEESYKVETLEGLESYIKVNKHLPGMPTAKQIEINGLELGEMIKLQQQKIEELTLHLIEKDKQLLNEKATNKKQQQQIDKVVKELAAFKKTIKH